MDEFEHLILGFYLGLGLLGLDKELHKELGADYQLHISILPPVEQADIM